jgi:hypothetical protein
MDNTGWRFRNLGLRLFESLLPLYPPRFRGEFSTEIRGILVSRMSEADGQGEGAWFAAAFHEITGLIFSILRERWHEHKLRKEKAMVPNDQPQKEISGGMGGMQLLRPAGTPGALWFTGWTLLTTAAIPAAMIAAPPLAVLLIWLYNLGVKAGFWASAPLFPAEAFGFLIGFTLALSFVQWVLLRKYLPRRRNWFLATGAGILLGGLVSGFAILGSSAKNWDPFWILAALLLPVGLALGLAQWLYLRRFLRNAALIIFVDVLAAASILVAGRTYTSLVELAVLVLPGAITGLGLWLLLNQEQPSSAALPSSASPPSSAAPPSVSGPAQMKGDRKVLPSLPRLARVGLGLAVLIPLFFGCSWVYAASQLALAKDAGVYPTVEQAILARSQGFGGAEVVRIEEVRAGPNRRDAQPHVWFGGATIYLDRVPEGHTLDYYHTGSFYIHVKEGWVFVGEGAFPEFIGWVMELYHMEGVN